MATLQCDNDVSYYSCVTQAVKGHLLSSPAHTPRTRRVTQVRRYPAQPEMPHEPLLQADDERTAASGDNARDQPATAPLSTSEASQAEHRCFLRKESRQAADLCPARTLARHAALGPEVRRRRTSGPGAFRRWRAVSQSALGMSECLQQSQVSSKPRCFDARHWSLLLTTEASATLGHMRPRTTETAGRS